MGERFKAEEIVRGKSVEYQSDGVWEEIKGMPMLSLGLDRYAHIKNEKCLLLLLASS